MAKCRKGREQETNTTDNSIAQPEEGQEFEHSHNEAVGSTHNIDEQDHIAPQELSAVVQEMNIQNSGSHDTGSHRESGDYETEEDEENTSESDNEPRKPLFGSHALVVTFTVLHIIAKLIVIAVNIVYLIKVGNPLRWYFFPYFFNILGNINITGMDLQLRVRATCFSEGITNFCILYETTFLVIGPILAIMLWVCCWRRQGRYRPSCCRKYLEFLRFNDLEVAILVAPFANINLFFLGNVWYTAIVARLLFYAITFSAAVIAGMRYVCAIYCFFCCSCGCNNEVMEIRNYKHLFADIGFQLFSIFLKLMTASSAFATYLKLGIQGSYHFRLMYLTFTVLRGVTSLFSLGFTAALLRWTVLKKEYQMARSCLIRTLGWLNKYQPHTHIAFVFDITCYTGLLALNLMIVSEQFVLLNPPQCKLTV